jgi:hypothetical protein
MRVPTVIARLGTVGWSISTWLIGRLIQNQGIQFMFYSYASIMASH